MVGTVPLSCQDFDFAMQPLPLDMHPPAHVSVGAVEPGMGNHLLDLSSPEFTGGSFSHTWIFGVWKGSISYFEPMITSAYLQSLKGKTCVDYALPEALPEAGYYPQQYCMAYASKTDSYQVSLENWKYRPQSSFR